MWSIRNVEWKISKEQLVREVMEERANFQFHDDEIPISGYANTEFGELDVVLCPYCLRGIKVGVGLHFRVVEVMENPGANTTLEVRWIRNRREIDPRELSDYRMFVRRQMPRIVRTVDSVTKFHHLWGLEFRDSLAVDLPKVYADQTLEFSIMGEGQGLLKNY